MLRFLLIALSFGLIFTSCDKDDTNDDTQTLTGKIRGVDFTFGGARYGSITDDLYRVIVFNEDDSLVEPCDSNTDEVYIDFKPSKSTDRAEMDATGFSTGTKTVVFHHPDHFQNLIIDRTGYYQITEDLNETITITMDFKFDDDNYMKGSFIATKCF